MRILLDVSASLPPIAGIGRYALELGRALLAQWPEAWPPPTFWFNSLRRRPEREGIHADYYRAAREGALCLGLTRIPGPLLLAAWNRLRLPAIETLAGRAFDVAHFPGSQIAPSRQAARIFTLHDLYFLRQPGHAHALGGGYLARALPRTLGDMDAVIVPSRATRDEALRHFPGVDPARMRVIPEGVNLIRFSPAPEEAAQEAQEALRALGIDRPYALVVATLEPRKNLGRLFAAFAQWREALPPPSAERPRPLLVGVGPPGWGGVTLDGLLRESALPPEAVRWFHGVTDETLAALYRGARVFVLPSLWEGFGLPVLEAMACGCPMVISRAGALAELVCEEEGEAEIPIGALLDPQAPSEAWARAIGVVFDAAPERRAAMSRAVRRRAEHFTWAAAARATLDVYRQAAAARNQTLGRQLM